jgi:hypothetical protein
VIAAAMALAEVMEPERRCDWPGCPLEPVAHGLCRPHGLRVERGAELGCEDAWDRLVAAALAIAAAETDEAFDHAAFRLDQAATFYRRTKTSLRYRR